MTQPASEVHAHQASHTRGLKVGCGIYFHIFLIQKEMNEIAKHRVHKKWTIESFLISTQIFSKKTAKKYFLDMKFLKI
jgi:hypothetical protein